MAFVRFFISSAILLVVIVASLVFSFRNDTVVDVDFIFFQANALSIGFWIVFSFIAGSVLGWVIALPSWLGLKFSHRHQKRRIENQQEEVLRLKGEPGK